MKELIEKLEVVDEAKCLFDTCFFIYELKHHKGLEGTITSFNAEEIIKVSHKLSSELKKDIRVAMKHHCINVVKIPVSPGNRDEEREFVTSVDPELLRLIQDPSDAVLIAAAIRLRVRKVYTRDKHHLYTSKLENYLKDWGVEVLNKYEG